MTDEPLSDSDLDRVRDGETCLAPEPEPPCSSCGVTPEWDQDNYVHHYWHAEDCRVVARITERLEAGDYDRYPPETKGGG